MPSPIPKVTSRGRWQPKRRASAQPPPAFGDLKDEHAPLRAGRLRPYVLTIAASLPLLAGLWIWVGAPSSPPAVPLPGHGRVVSQGLPTPSIKLARVTLGEGGIPSVLTELAQDAQAPITLRYQWYRNGAPLPGQTGARLSAGVAQQGDRFTVEVTPSNGSVDGAIYKTPEWVMGNSPPSVLKLTLEPKAPRAGDTIRVVAEVTDVDEHQVTLSYRWLKNGNLIQDGPGAVLKSDELLRGDRLVVEVVPNDGQSDGMMAQSEETIIGNGHPRITSTPALSVDGGRVKYAIVATDPDHDPLEFRLTAGPQGMTVGKTSGLLEWVPTAGAQGDHHVRVEVADNHDGVAVQEFDVTVPGTPAS